MIIDCIYVLVVMLFFFFNDTATTEIYTLSLHDALPISTAATVSRAMFRAEGSSRPGTWAHDVGRSGHSHPRNCRGCHRDRDRKSTRLNSSHANISYAVFCLKKKKIINKRT